ncbi:MAG: amidohydrolase family protein [Rhodospirillaceae bacterium]|nr:amidohydrolase family protein [Rhodospirillaceae bacterium]
MTRFTVRVAGALLAVVFVYTDAAAHGLDEPPYQSPPAGAARTVETARPRQAPGQTLPLRPTRRVSFDTSEGTWMSVDVAPDGGTLVFDLLGDIYTLGMAGGRAKHISRGLAFDAQPSFSPDGKLIAFISDRSGAENLWVMRPDGGGARQISFGDDDTVLVSPAWSTDGAGVFVSRYRPSFNGYELWRYGLDGSETLLKPIAATTDQSDESWTQSLGAAPSPDGRAIYLARHSGRLEYEKTPEWTIVRRDLASGAEETIVAEPEAPRKALYPGSAFRPAVSPDGKWLAYASRFDNQTGLRLRDLKTGDDRWLAFPITHDVLMAAAWQDLVPGYAFTPDSTAIILSRRGGFERIEIAGGTATPIRFTAKVDLELGPLTRPAVRQETGLVRARLVQTPEISPDGKNVAFSTLGRLYVMPLEGKAAPKPVTVDGPPAFHPSWSPDGNALAYVTWTAKDGGHIWSTPSDGSGNPRRIDQDPAKMFYTRPAFTPDGRTVVALRSPQRDRLHTYMEYGPLRKSELVTMPAAGGTARVVSRGMLGGKPHFSGKADETYVLSDTGLKAIHLESGAARTVAALTGPGYYFVEGPVPVDDIRISPDGKWLLAQIVQQLHVIEIPPAGHAGVDLSRPGLRHRRITDVGADFFGWSADGRDIFWSIGSTIYRRPLSAVRLNAATAPNWRADAPAPGVGGVRAVQAVVELPRDMPRGTVVLRGARAITMAGDKIIDDADIVVTDDKIAGIGPRGSVPVPPGAEIIDQSGRTIMPGFIDNHDHVADVRRDVLDMESWGFRARLADGVTTAFDPSTLTIDMLAYQDLLDAGLMIGSRVPSTGIALFSFNRFSSLDEVRQVLRRYRDHYRTQNIKAYRTGNRRVRQWVAQASAELGMLPTTEGALSMKLDLSQVMDGFSGNEHALVAPLYRDVIELMARSRTSYTTTLQITHGGPQGQDYFIARDEPHGDKTLTRFMPHFAIDQMTQQREWRPLSAYMFPQVAHDAALIQRAGGVIGMGAHGEMPGRGFHWEMEAHVMGGMTPMEALRAGTMGAAETIGRDGEFGSLEAGKYADLVVLERDPRDDIRNARALVQVMKNGRLYEAATLNEVWPRRKPLSAPWFAEEVPHNR